MTTELLYLYTRRNLLDQPEFYMYSAYHAEAFLPEYFSQRKARIFDFEFIYLKLLENSDRPDMLWLNLWSDVLIRDGDFLSGDMLASHNRFMTLKETRGMSSDNRSFEELKSSSHIYTEPWLRLLLRSAFERDQANRDNFLFWLDRFARRYEITKKLYSAYQLPMKAASEDYTNGLNYALLTLALLYEFEWTQNLKALNTALKLNDLLCSTARLATEPETLLVTILALHKETNFIRQMAVSKKVRL